MKDKQTENSDVVISADTTLILTLEVTLKNSVTLRAGAFDDDEVDDASPLGETGEAGEADEAGEDDMVGGL